MVASTLCMVALLATMRGIGQWWLTTTAPSHSLYSTRASKDFREQSIPWLHTKLVSFVSGPNGEARPRLTTTIVSSALDQETPIMLSTHVYWNLNSFKQQTVLNDTTVWMPYAYRYIETDGNLIPNGTIGTVASRPALDFLAPKTVGAAIDVAQGVCGTGCTGVDNAFILDRPTGSGDTTMIPGISMWSSTTGIKMDMQTNQQGVQIYTCNGQNGTIPVRQSVQNANKGNNASAQYVQKHGCVVIEPQAWIDGINHPEWESTSTSCLRQTHSLWYSRLRTISQTFEGGKETRCSGNGSEKRPGKHRQPIELL